MTRPVRLAVFGAAGRMGRAILRRLETRTDVEVVCAVVRQGSTAQGQAVSPNLPGLCFSPSMDADAALDVIIDVSGADGFDAALATAVDRRVAFVSGSTGLEPVQQRALDDAAICIPVLWASNFSVGVAVLRKLVREAARALPDFDCEIVEAHHRHKKDAPSGTALALGDAVAQGRRIRLEDHAVAARDPSHGARRGGEIGFAVIRGGDVVGDHTVMLLGDGERIELSHRASDRDVFAEGALRAARWIAGKSAARYTMDDVIA